MVITYYRWLLLDKIIIWLYLWHILIEPLFCIFRFPIRREELRRGSGRQHRLITSLQFMALLHKQSSDLEHNIGISRYCFWLEFHRIQMFLVLLRNHILSWSTISSILANRLICLESHRIQIFLAHLRNHILSWSTILISTNEFCLEFHCI